MSWLSRYTITRRGLVGGSVSAVGTLGVAGCTNNVQAPAQPQPKTELGKLAIIHTNDAHGHDLLNDESLGLAAVAQLKTDWEKKGYEVLLFDCGDVVQGDKLVRNSKGIDAIDFMNEVGYDAMALGNHEFDYGQDKVYKYVEMATFPILSANTIVEATGKSMVQLSTTLTLKDGRKVGVFGLTTPSTETSANPLLVKGIDFLGGEDLYACAQDQVDDLRQQGCDLVVCLGHLGEDDGLAPNRAMDVVANTSGIDLFIDGHDHKEEAQTIKDAAGKDTLVVEADCYTHMVGVVTWEDGKLAQQFVRFGEYDGQDATVAAAIQEVADKVDEGLSVVVATTPFVLNGEREPGVRTEETNLGDLLADVILWEAQQSSEDTPDLAIINGGCIRATLNEGDITTGGIIDVVPFENYICTVRVTGAQLLEALEASCFNTPNASGSFPQVTGIVFTLNVSVPYEQGDLYPKSTYHAPARPGSRVTIQTVNGKPFDEGATYTIASVDFVDAGGDTYYVFSEATQKTLKGTGYLISDAFRYFLEEACDGVVPQEYEHPQGRITIVS